jgi:hypothetical protein
MKAHDLSAFLGRCRTAKRYGWAIAHAEDYAARIAKIAGSVPSPDGTPHSVDHLIALAEQALRVQAGEAPVVEEPKQEAKTAAAKPKKGKRKADAEPEPEEDIIVLPSDD